MTTAILPPGFTIRGAAVLASLDPRWDPEARRSVHHEPEIGPQDDGDDLAVSLGFRLYAYAAGLICATLGLLVLVGTAGLAHLTEAQAYATVALAVLWGASFTGVMDYALRGARR